MVVKFEFNVVEQAATNKGKNWTNEERQTMYESVTYLRENENMDIVEACDRCAEYLGRTSKGVENEYYKYKKKLEFIQSMSVTVNISYN